MEVNQEPTAEGTAGGAGDSNDVHMQEAGNTYEGSSAASAAVPQPLLQVPDPVAIIHDAVSVGVVNVDASAEVHEQAAAASAGHNMVDVDANGGVNISVPVGVGVGVDVGVGVNHVTNIPMPVMMAMPPLKGVGANDNDAAATALMHATEQTTPQTPTVASLASSDAGTATPKSSRKQQARMDGIWYKHLEELKHYKRSHGTVSVPRKSGQLGEWCRTQRRYYRMYRKGESVPLTKERMKALEALGFIWFPAEERKKRKREASLKALVKGDPSLGIHADSIGLGLGVGGGIKMQYTTIEDEQPPKGEEKVENAEGDEPQGNGGEEYSSTSLTGEGVAVDAGAEANDSTTSPPPQKKQKLHATPALSSAHSKYNASIKALQTANEKLCDAQDMLEKAMQAHQDALQYQKDAAVDVERACEVVLERELEDHPEDEWVQNYVKLKKYHEEHGEVLFAKGLLQERAARNAGSETFGREDATATATVNAEVIDVHDANECHEDVTEELLDESAEEIVDVDVDAAAVAEADADGQGEVQDQDQGQEVEADATAEEDGEAKETVAATECENNEDNKGNSNGEDDPEKALSDWVSTLRKAPKKSVSEWRHKALDKLGFIWNQYDAIWTARYRELVAYKEKHGNTQVPTSYPALGVWVGTQRKQYRLKTKGKYSHMTDERMAMLNDIGFVWEVNNWMEKFLELKQFHSETGHFLVPTGT